MAYGTRAAAKEWANIPSSNTANDTEIDNILAVVDREIDVILKKYTTLPLQTPLTNEIADIANKWTAGIYNQRRNPAKTELIVEAKEDLQRFIETYFSGFEVSKFG